ncbi:MAG: multicopper oxidase domain-containing protein [Candidatus Sulfotelmatobacter sp.]
MSAQKFRRRTSLAATLLACSSYLFSQNSNQQACPRPAIGSPVTSPAEIRSDHGSLTATLSFRTSLDPSGQIRYCYIDADGHQSPTLRVHPGDLITLKLKNDLPKGDLLAATPPAPSHPATTPCSPAHMTADSTNLHFHGLSIPPACHQDESLNTRIQPADPAFEYQFRIPATQTPGLYWYHPHIHGNSEAQLLGGASGALIVEEPESKAEEVKHEPGKGSKPTQSEAKKRQANENQAAKDAATNPTSEPLPERIFVIRDQSPAPDAEPGHPAKDLSVNFIAVPYPRYPMAILRTRPSRREFWRVLNACADTYLDLGVLFNGRYRQLGLVAVDGAPLARGPGHADGISWQNDIPIPPGGRAEFVLDTPAEHVDAELLTLGVDTSLPNDEDNPKTRTAISTTPVPESDDANPPRQLVKIIASADADETPTQTVLPAPAPASDLARAKPVRERRFYFSEKVLDPQHPATSTVYYITEQGAKPEAFRLAAAPNVTVRSGDVEDWVIENRSQESHAFHIHQLHFLTLQRDGAATKEPYLRDTIDVPYWDGTSPHFPSVKLRMDFRDPNIVGKFPYHCHVLQHADGGMMGVIEVKPKLQK